MRYLKGNKGCRSPQRLVFWDTETKQTPIPNETKGIENKFWFGCATAIRLEKGEVSRREKLPFFDRTKFWDWLEKRATTNTQTYIFAHNLAFDLTITGFWLELDSGRFRLSDDTALDLDGHPIDPTKKPWSGMLVRSDPPTAIKVRTKNNSTLTFCDTLNWFKTSLDKLGDRMNLPKLEFPSYDDDIETWLEYCWRDVEVIEKTMIDYIQWLRNNDLGNFKITAPSQAFTAYKHRFKPAEILLHDNEDVKALERDSYYGGRLESFYIGELREDSVENYREVLLGGGGEHNDRQRNFYGVDVNSLYPSVMRKLPYPSALETYREFPGGSVDAIKEICHRCVADVHISTRGAYPKRMEGIGVVYPTGTYRTTLAGPELIRAIRAGDIRSVYKYSRYSLRPLFTDYVDFFWHKRRECKENGDSIGDTFCKLFLNSFYGKWAQLTCEFEKTGASVPGEEWEIQNRFRGVDGRFSTVHNIAGVRYVKITREDHPNSFCAIASFVTAYARERMLELMHIAGEGNYFYIVTDGLFINRDGYENLQTAGEISESELGKLSVKSSCNRGWLGGVHWYEVGEIIKKGSNKKRAVVLSDGNALQERWERLSGILKRGPTDTVRIYPQNKYYRRSYKRGNVDPVGNVTPLILNEPIQDGVEPLTNADSPPDTILVTS